ncbi:MAG: hypothetical protein IJ193_03100 [Bacilli bacterium]|nr:hypothetical protein [Bacilli bacterium]
MRNIVIKSSETTKLNEYLHTNYKELQVLGIVNGDEVKSMDPYFDGFYQKYQKEILSFLPEDKKKIYDETGIRVCNCLTLKGSVSDKIYLSVTLGSIHYHRRGEKFTNYDAEYKTKEEEYFNSIRKSFESGEIEVVHRSDELGCDVMVGVEVQDVTLESDGIYSFEDGQKELLYSIK